MNLRTSFSSLPSGHFSDGSFAQAGPVADGASSLFTDAVFWTATQSTEISAWTRRLVCNTDQVFITNSLKTNGYSVRCVRDAESDGPISHLIELNTLTN